MTRRRIKELLDREGPRIRERFRSVMQRVKDQRTISELETALAEGRISEVLDDVEKAATVIASHVTSVQTAVSHEATSTLVDKLEAAVSYDTTHPATVDALRENRGRLISGVTDEQRRVIVDALSEGAALGDNPREMARAIRDTIGLTQQQADWVRAYRRRLEALDPAALGMELRDKRHDGVVDRAIESKTKLTPAQVDKMVERYATKALNYRAEVVARSEALTAVHEGMDHAYSQAVDNGTLPAEQLEQKWLTGPRPRPSHLAMHGQTRPWGEPFTSGDGNSLRYPGDRDAPPSDRVQCNCARAVRVLPPSKTPQAREGEFAITKRNTMERIVIAGASGTGKTTLGKEMAAALGLSLISSDDFIGMGWSEASAHVAEIMADGAARIVEGVAMPRALRKLLMADPATRPCDRLIVLTTPRREQTAKQIAQGKGAKTVLDEILPALLALGVAVEVRDGDPAPPP